jgi:hypothetical protein
MKTNQKINLIVLLLLITFAGCELANKLLDFENSLTVSKGDYPDKIHISWSNNFGDEDAPTTYTVYKDGFDVHIEAIGTSWDDDEDVDPGVMYEYYVEGDGTGLTTDTKSGYAMDAAELEIWSGLWSHPENDTTSTITDYNDIAWYHFYAQEGWTYDFLVREGDDDLDLSLFDRSSIDPADALRTAAVPSTTADGITGWKCPDSGEYYLKIISDSDNTSFSYCARYRN